MFRNGQNHFCYANNNHSERFFCQINENINNIKDARYFRYNIVFMKEYSNKLETLEIENETYESNNNSSWKLVNKDGSTDKSYNYYTFGFKNLIFNINMIPYYKYIFKFSFI